MSETCDLHASAAAFNGHAVLILGSSGSGKSSLLIDLLALGFTLIGDDRVKLERRENKIWATPIAKAQRRFEARGIGIFEAKETCEAPISIVVNLDETPNSRLPDLETVNQLGIPLSKISGKGANNLANLLYLIFAENVKRLKLD